MRGSLAALCGLLALTCSVQATYYHVALGCECHGRSRYCLRDAEGLRCVDCEGNTEGRHCERCRAGFYLQEDGRACAACLCHHTGAASSQCDSRGRCSCKEGFSGLKCELCEDGKRVGVDGCTRSRQLRQDSGSWSPSCFCFGHSSECSPQSDYYVHNITSTFSQGLDGWRAATVDGQTPQDVYFRWSPTYGDVEVISSNSLPVYLYAPARFLGDQLHSYGQNLSFFLRLDRGVRQPSITDVILEGAGLRVSTSLGDLRHSVPCGHKRYYSFRLEESQWSPQLSPFTFQKLLQNLTAIKIRASFGHSGRGYLDNVSLVSARPDEGTVPAPWVQSCRCPPGLEGPQCERCAQGYRRSEPGRGAFSDCEPCQCPEGSCDAMTGECLSSDDSQGLCQHGYAGPKCTDCAEGFYRETVRGDGFPAPCQPCACDKDGSVSAQCDSSGTCRCKTGFEGQKCDRSKCPSCFDPVAAQLEQFTDRLLELEQYFSAPENSEDLEAALKAAQTELDNLEDQHQTNTDAERRLQRRLSSLASEQLTLGQELDGAARVCKNVYSSAQKYTEQADTIEDLSQDMRRLLEQAQRRLRSVELPQADAPSDGNPFTPLLQTALDLLQKHQSDAASTGLQANEALRDSEQSASLAQPLVEREKKVQTITEDLKGMLGQISAEVKDMEAQVPQVGAAAKGQSKKAARLLQDILKAEKDLPSPLKPEDMLSRFNRLKTDADGNLEELEELQASVEQDQTEAMDLLKDGKAAQEAFDKLVSRVDLAKVETEEALRRMGSNTEALDDALTTLRGFDDQMDRAKAQADAAIGRLPGIKAAVQSANRDNGEAQALVGGVSEQLKQAEETRDQLQDAVDNLQGLWSSVPDTSDLLDQATHLRSEAEKLQAGSTSTAAEVQKELSQAQDLQQQATQGAEDVQAALDNTQRTRDAVRRTLRDVNNMINSLNGSEPVDTSRLERLEGSLEAAGRDVNLSLAPRLERLEQTEEAHRRYLSRLDRDLASILRDIGNIEDILSSVPQGCYNNAPLEEA